MAVLLLMGTVLAASGGGSGAGDSKGSGTSASGDLAVLLPAIRGGEGTSEVTAGVDHAFILV